LAIYFFAKTSSYINETRFQKRLRKEREKKSAVKNELHKFHAERLLNIHITYIFSAEEKFHF